VRRREFSSRGRPRADEQLEVMRRPVWSTRPAARVNSRRVLSSNSNQRRWLFPSPPAALPSTSSGHSPRAAPAPPRAGW